MPEPGYVPPEDNSCLFQPCIPSGPRLDQLRAQNNPQGEPVGAFTGRCAHCGSQDLWDDNLAYGCHTCGAILGGN